MDDQLKPYDVDRKVEHRIPGKRNECCSEYERQMNHKQVLEAEPQVREELASLGNRVHDAAEIVVQQNDGGDFPCAPRTPPAHGDADVSRLQRRHVIHAVTGYCHDVSLSLQRTHEIELLCGNGAGDHVQLAQNGRVAVLEQVFQLIAFDDAGLVSSEPDLARNGACSHRVIASDHNDPDVRGLTGP